MSKITKVARGKGKPEKSSRRPIGQLSPAERRLVLEARKLGDVSGTARAVKELREDEAARPTTSKSAPDETLAKLAPLEKSLVQNFRRLPPDKQTFFLTGAHHTIDETVGSIDAGPDGTFQRPETKGRPWDPPEGGKISLPNALFEESQTVLIGRITAPLCGLHNADLRLIAALVDALYDGGSSAEYETLDVDKLEAAKC